MVVVAPGVVTVDPTVATVELGSTGEPESTSGLGATGRRQRECL